MPEKASIPEMLAKLNELYDKEQMLIQNVNILTKQYHQLQEDKELLQNLIMYESNRQARIKNVTNRNTTNFKRASR